MRARVRREAVINVVLLILVVVLGAGYVSVGLLRINPFARHTSVSLVIPNSNQVARGTSVTLRGVPIGEVTGVAIAGTGALVTLVFDASRRVPRDSHVAVMTRSALGEPAVDFQPTGTDGPLLTSGSVIDESQVTISTPVSEFFELMKSMSALFPPDATAGLLKTAAEAFDDTEDSMRVLSVGGQLLASTISSRRPELVTMFTATQGYMAKLPALITALRGVETTIGPLAMEFRNALDSAQFFVQRADLPAGLDDTLMPFLNKLVDYLLKISPPATEALAPFIPIYTAIDQILPQINVSRFLSDLLSVVSSERNGALQIRLQPPR